MTQPEIYLIVGLGNPGNQYAHNRHNVGFWLADALHAAHAFSPWQSKFKAQYSRLDLGAQRIHLLKPQTFMNKSGESVVEAARFFKIEPQHILVAYDELDIAPGRLRLKQGGGAAGHNGLHSITQCLGSDAYQRLRVGIGHPGHKSRVTGYVLGNFTTEETDLFERICKKTAQKLEMLVSGKGNDALSQLAQEGSTSTPSIVSS